MAGETRRQRRDARRASGETSRALEPRAPEMAPAGATGSATPPAGPIPAAPPESSRRGFIGESIAELKKVEWPSRAQVIQGTIVVIIACAIVGAFLWGVDQALRPFVRDILIG